MNDMPTDDEIREKYASTFAKYPGETLGYVRLSNGDEVLVRNPGRPAYLAFKSSLGDAQKRPMAVEQLALGAVVHPTRAELQAFFDRKPAAADVVGSKVLELMGADMTAEKKEL